MPIDESQLNDAIAHAEDGLDPGDALTPREALARVLCLLRGVPEDHLYADDDIVGGPLVICVMRWSEDRPGERAGWRDRLERGGFIRGWVVD